MDARRAAERSASASTGLPRAARAALGELYRRVDREVAGLGAACWIRGDCCDFEREQHVLYASRLETAYAAEESPGPRAPAPERLCPFWQGRKCALRDRRPLGCRTHFCDRRYRAALEEIHERYLAEIRRISERSGIPWDYAPFPQAVRRALRET